MSPKSEDGDWGVAGMEERWGQHLWAFLRSPSGGRARREPMHFALCAHMATARPRLEAGIEGLEIESRARGRKVSACPRNALVIGDHSQGLKRCLSIAPLCPLHPGSVGMAGGREEEVASTAGWGLSMGPLCPAKPECPQVCLCSYTPQIPEARPPTAAAPPVGKFRELHLPFWPRGSREEEKGMGPCSKLVGRAGMKGGLWLKQIGRCHLVNSTYFLVSGL